jgi:hypothetical protein
MQSREIAQPLSVFFTALEEEDVVVRKSAFLLLNTAYFYHPSLSEHFDLFKFISPHLIRNLTFKNEITLDLGAVKHKEDQGLPLRKASLTCLETMLGCFGDSLDVLPFVDSIKTNLSDKDVRIQACQVIQKMCSTHALTMSSLTTKLIEPLNTMLEIAAAEQTKIKSAGSAAGSPEYDRCTEVFRMCIRTIDEISKIDTVTHNPLWIEFSNRVKKNPTYNASH